MQGLPSLQSKAAPGLQVPSAQASLTVQMLLSVHEPMLFLWVQPVIGSQASSVQTLLSTQFFWLPGLQAPPSQVSFSVQTLLSLHPALLLSWVQPFWPSQASSVHGLPSKQPNLPSGVQAPPLQVSPVEHASPSSQGRVLLALVQPTLASQASVVQRLLSSQTLAAPGTQKPPAQVSSVLQTLPSLHWTVFATCLQPALAPQESLVQELPSSQLKASPG